ncbi:MAG: permease-like cell division protein FtsX [Bacillota bacterium]|nr:permease-like cell division protein FtsX [Bacillota bacterium]
MKIRTIKYIVKEGTVNAYRNRFMTFASIGIVTLSMLAFGIFYLFAVNINHNAGILKNQLEFEVFCKPELGDVQVNQIEQSIKSSSGIISYTKVTKDMAFENAKKMLGDDKDILNGFDNNFLPVSFKIKIKDSVSSEVLVNKFKSMDGVDSVKYPQAEINFVTKGSAWIRLVMIALLLILLVVSLFIISNTIKLTLFARRREINIMKYIGATDWFIRWPFVVEGVIIGLSGVIISFVVSTYLYNMVQDKLSKGITDISNGMMGLVSMKDVGFDLFGIFILIGISVGIAGSMISIRKHLRV